MNKLNKFSRAIVAIAMMLTVGFPSFAHDFEVDGFYYDLWKNGKLNKVKTVASFWGLLTDAVPKERMEKLKIDNKRIIIYTKYS